MNTPLTEEQRELLSAFADGETTEPERQAAEQLLQREDAREYFDSLRATITLVKTHAPVRAPVGLSGRVLNALEDEFKPKAIGPGSEPFTGAPVISWRTPLYAAAAAIVVSLAIMFGPSLVGPRDGSPSSVARTVLDNLPAPAAEAGSDRDAFNRRAVEEPAADPGMPADELAEEMEKNRGAAQGGNWGGTREDLEDNLRDLEAAKTGATLKGTTEDRPGENAGKKAKDTQSVEGEPAPNKSEAKGLARGEGSEDDKNALNEAEDSVEADAKPANESNEDENKKAGTKSDHEKYDGRAGHPPTGGGAGGAVRPRPERRNQDAEEKETADTGSGPSGDEAEAQRVKRAREGGAPAPAAPEPPSESGAATEAGEAETLLEISDAGTIAAQTDVLWVSSLYGKAQLADSDEEAEIENVTVEIDADKLPELLAALRKLAADQGYGKVAGGGEEEPAVRKAEAEPRITGYLPSEEPEEAQSESMLRAPAKVRVVIRLK
ncbi:MAG: hypothetical protein H6841_00885 [Planctomycetes bacterium]|nr:hypothetical protein [Planctomycetota bacterium]MCB9935942.1 hypothetical protein [Planctomycetota bacterium]